VGDNLVSFIELRNPVWKDSYQNGLHFPELLQRKLVGIDLNIQDTCVSVQLKRKYMVKLLREVFNESNFSFEKIEDENIFALSELTIHDGQIWMTMNYHNEDIARVNEQDIISIVQIPQNSRRGD
jgi:hypothetical protein